MRTGCILLTIATTLSACRANERSPAALVDEREAATVFAENAATVRRSMAIDADRYLMLLALEPAPEAPPAESIRASLWIDSTIDDDFTSDRLFMRVVQADDAIWFERTGGVGGVTAWIGPMRDAEAAALMRIDTEELRQELGPDTR